MLDNRMDRRPAMANRHLRRCVRLGAHVAVADSPPPERIS